MKNVTKISFHGFEVIGENLESLLATVSRNGSEYVADGLTDILQSLAEFSPTVASVRAPRVNGAAPNVEEDSEEETLAETYRKSSGKRFRHMGAGSRLDGLRDWYASLSDETRAKLDGGETSAESAAPIPEMTEEDAEASL